MNAREVNAHNDTLQTAKWPRLIRYGLPIFFGFCFIILAMYIIGKSYVFRGDFLNVIHVSHWMTIVMAVAILWSGMHMDRRWSIRPIWALVALAMILGVSARVHVFFKENSLFPSYVPYVSTINWVREHIPKEDGICADPQHGEVFGSFSGRFIYPTYLTEFLPKSDEEIVNDVRVEMGYYDVQSAIARDVYIQIFDSMDTTCSQFSVWSRLFILLGWSNDYFDKMSGCLRAEVEAVENRLSDYASDRHRDDAYFRLLCPAVIIANDQRSSWSLPADYRETKIDGIFSVWRTGMLKP
jgi:hypothetical protein